MSSIELEPLVADTVKTFRETFTSEPEVCCRAPGRVNLIGDHTDYNGGYVLPMDIQLHTIIVGRKRTGNTIRVLTTSADVGEPTLVEFDLPSTDSPLVPGEPKWANYVKGPVACFKGTPCAFDAVVATTVPLGGGLSSSAALEVAVYTFLEQITNTYSSKLEKALACQKAEHEFANMPCGIMDQFVISKGEAGNALLIDCQSLEGKLIPMKNPEIVILVTNSNVRHELSTSEYPQRKRHCEVAAKILGMDNLRQATVEDLNDHREQFSDLIFKRARHVITEIGRTAEAANALCQGNHVKFGKLMVESHNSLRDDYEVSCPELDALVEAALEIDGVYGSRMTGGGFGGCTVTLLENKAVDAAIENMEMKCNRNLTFYICVPSNGCQNIPLSDYVKNKAIN